MTAHNKWPHVIYNIDIKIPTCWYHFVHVWPEMGGATNLASGKLRDQNWSFIFQQGALYILLMTQTGSHNDLLSFPHFSSLGSHHTSMIVFPCLGSPFRHTLTLSYESSVLQCTASWLFSVFLHNDIYIGHCSVATRLSLVVASQNQIVPSSPT